jgi:anti-sigma B factor antagonist
LNLAIEEHDGFTLARISGNLSAHNAPELTDALADHAFGTNARLAIELSELTVLDSSGLGVLIHIVTRARMTGGRVLLVAPSTFVSGVLNVTRLDAWFDICESIDEAAHRFSQT